MENLAGHDIKGYELRERIGSGGFGAVYRAIQSTVGREVAIKIILPGFANHPDFVRRFEAEAQIIARLEHPYITPLFDFWRDAEGAYLVMRFLRGGSLRDALTKQVFAPDAAVVLLDQLTAALSVAHRHQVIHRDLKPGNILLDEDGNAYLADFGIAKQMGIPGATEMDVIVGSPDYLAPEQARSEPVTPQTDVYSLGVVLYEMLTGEHPFPSLSPVDRLYKHLNDPLPEIQTLPDDTRDGINAVIQKATAKNPAFRYADAPSVATAFREALRVQRSANVVETLTQREQEILQRVIAGHSNRQIADDLVVTVGTVKWYITQIYRKLNVRSRVQAIVRARELRLITSEAIPQVGIVADAMTVIPLSDFTPDNPYKGLRAFQVTDNRDFYGREKLIDKLIRRMSEKGEASRFLAVVGPSGSGKSSLVKAGLIPALWRGDLAGSEKWFVAEMLPGAHPLDELEIALTRVGTSPAAHLREHLVRDERGLLRAAQLLLPEDNSQIVLVIDQFEEVFTLVTDEAERVHFLKLLHTAVTESRSRVHIVITLRADFYDRPLQYPDFGELVRTRMETIMPLSAEELERAITQPAERAGVSFATGLVASIVAEVNYQPGALPLLQYALTELFERREGRTLTHAAYQQIGGAGGALAQRAEDVYQEFGDAGRECVRQMFLRLVTLGEGVADTRRRTQRSELLGIATDADVMDEVIDTFAAYRLLSLDKDPGTRSPTVEVAHEAILKAWDRLNQWVTMAREEIKMQQQLAQLTESWVNGSKDGSYLIGGLRLTQFEQWAKDSQLALTADERAYLNASMAHREAEHQAETERKAREISLERRSQTFLRGLVAVFAVATAIALLLTGFAVNQSNQTQQALATSDANFQIAQNQSRLATSRELAGYASSKLETDGQLGALLALQAADITKSVDGTVLPEVQTILHQAVQGLGASSRQIPSAVFPSEWIFNFMFSEDGTQLFFPLEADQVSGAAGVTGVANVATGELLYTIPGDIVVDGVINGQMRTLSGASHEPTVTLWDVSSSTGAEAVKTVAVPFEFADWNDFSSDLRFAVSVSSVGRITEIWNLETGEQIVTPAIESLSGINGQPIFSHDASLLGNLNADGTISILETETWTEISRLSIAPNFFNKGFNFGKDSQTVTTSNSDDYVSVWDPRTGEEIVDAVPVDGQPRLTAISNGGTRVAVKNTTNLVTVFDMASGQVINEFTAPASIWMTFNPDGSLLATLEYNGTVTLWNLDESFGVLTMNNGVPDPDLGPLSVAYSPHGTRVVAASVIETPIIWDAVTGQKVLTLTGHSDRALTVAWSADGATIASAGNDTDVRLWNAATGESLKVLSGHEDSIYAVAFSPDSTRVASSSSDGTVRIWDVVVGDLLVTLTLPTASKGVAWSPDGTRIAAGTNIADGNSHLIIFDSTTGEQQLDILVGDTRMGAVTFSPDGLRVVGGTLDGHAAKVWDAQMGKELLSLDYHTDLVGGVAYSPDGTTIATGSHDGTVRLWNAVTGEELLMLIGAPEGIPRLSFSPDGTHLATANEDGTTRIYVVAIDDLIALAKSRLTRTLTDAECQRYLHVETCPA